MLVVSGTAAGPFCPSQYSPVQPVPRPAVFQYNCEQDVGFSASLAMSLLLLIFLGGVQAVVLPRTLILLLLFLTAFVWIAVVLMLLLAVRLRYEPRDGTGRDGMGWHGTGRDGMD